MELTQLGGTLQTACCRGWLASESLRSFVGSYNPYISVSRDGKNNQNARNAHARRQYRQGQSGYPDSEWGPQTFGLPTATSPLCHGRLTAANTAIP